MKHWCFSLPRIGYLQSCQNETTWWNFYEKPVLLELLNFFGEKLRISAKLVEWNITYWNFNEKAVLSSLTVEENYLRFNETYNLFHFTKPGYCEQC